MSSGLIDEQVYAKDAPPHSPLEVISATTDSSLVQLRRVSYADLRRSAKSGATPMRPSVKRDTSDGSPAPRKRISRACDACNSLRTKCNGNFPCNHCSASSISCTYLRERKKRGKVSRKDLAAQQVWLAASNDGEASISPASQQPPAPSYPTANTHAANNHPQPRINGVPSPARASVSAEYQRHSTINEQVQAGARQHDFASVDNPSGRTAANSAIRDSGSDRQTFNPFVNRPRDTEYTNDGRIRYQERLQHQATERPLPLQTFNSVTSAPDSSSHSLPSPSSQGAIQQAPTVDKQFAGSPLFHGILGQSPFPYSPGRVELPSPRGAFNIGTRTRSDQWLRYPVLIPILPRITAIMPVSLACDLLDIYFASLTPSVRQPASPYILAFTLRSKSVLRSENPRPCSKALLVSMLWVGAHTCESSFLTSPPSQRAKICTQLLELSISLLNPLVHVTSRSSFATGANGMVNMPSLHHSSGANLAARSDESGGLAGGTVTLDDVITYATIATVVSASEFKAASLRWWTAAFTVARELKLGKELLDPADGRHYNEDNDRIDMYNTHDGPDIYSSQSKQTVTEETREERRRTWWLLYAVDRHLALCYNRPLHLRDAECQNLLQPELDDVFQAGDHYPAETDVPVHRPRGPCVECTGHGMFGYFLPLMTILGYIIDLHLAQEHPIYGQMFTESQEPERHKVNIAVKLEQYGMSLARFRAVQATAQQANGGIEADEQTKTVVAYGTHLMHTLHVAMHGRWDPIALLDDNDRWISSTSFVTATQHAVAAAEAIREILEYDPDLSFMPFFFGIYLLQGSFLLLLIADKLRDEADPSVVKACETIVRAHEVCVVTLNTEYQRNFRNVMRSALAQVKGRVLEDPGIAEKKRREVLALYRWTDDGTGLAL